MQVILSQDLSQSYNPAGILSSNLLLISLRHYLANVFLTYHRVEVYFLALPMNFSLRLLIVWDLVSPRDDYKERIQDRALVLLSSDLRSDTPWLLPYMLLVQRSNLAWCAELHECEFLEPDILWGHCRGSYHVRCLHGLKFQFEQCTRYIRCRKRAGKSSSWVISMMAQHFLFPKFFSCAGVPPEQNEFVLIIESLQWLLLSLAFPAW